MAKMNKQNLQKHYNKSLINLYERKKVIALEYNNVLEKQYELKKQSLLEKKARKNRQILLPLEKNAISRKEYNQSLIKLDLEKFEEKQYWQKRAFAQSKFKNIQKNPDNSKFFEDKYSEQILQLTAQKEAYIDLLSKKYPLENLETKIEKEHQDIYNNKTNELDIAFNEYKERLDVKYKEKLLKETAKNDKHIKKIDEKLSKLYISIDKIFKLEREKLEVKRNELKVAIENKTSSNIDADIIELDEIESLFELYNSDNDIQLRVKNLTMNFGGLKAVDNLSFDVKKGEIFGLIGPNGAGKTTVFNCITQFYKPSLGKIYYDYKEQVTDLNTIKVHDIIRQGIVRTFQNVELIWELSILDNLLVAGHTLYRSNFFTQLLHLPKLAKEEEVVKAKALRVLEYLDLIDYKDIPPIGLPYGILKRIELARTFMTDPKLIILDEPAAGLNDTETLELAKIIKKIRDDFGTTIFLVEHDMGLVMDVCDNICAISFGKMLAIGTPDVIQKNPKVQEAYLGGE